MIVGKYSLNWNANAQVWTNGTPTSMAWGDWKSNWAWSFNWSSSYIEAPASFTNNQDVTVSCMVKIITNPIWQSKIIVLTSNNQFLMTIYYVTISWAQYLRMSNTIDSAYTATHTINLAWTGWRNIGITKIGTTQQIYVDWIPVWTTWNSWTSGVWPFSSIISIWKTAGASTQFFNWLIDEVEIDNTGLSPARMRNKALYYNWFI